MWTIIPFISSKLDEIQITSIAVKEEKIYQTLNSQKIPQILTSQVVGVVMVGVGCVFRGEWDANWVYAGLPRIREKSGKKIFFQGQGIVREFEKMSGKFWKGANVREMSGNFILGFRKVCHVIIFIHKITWFSNCKLNFLSSWLEALFPVILVSSKSHQIWHSRSEKIFEFYQIVSKSQESEEF